MADPYRRPDSKPHTTPRWVKVFGIIMAVLVLAFIAMVLLGGGPPGGHGLGRHAPSGDAGGQAPPSSVMGHAPSEGGRG